MNKNIADLSNFIVELNQSNAVITTNFLRGSYNEAGEFHKVLTYVISDGFKKIIVDFKDVDFIDSTFLGSLVIGLKKIKESGGKLILVNLSPSVSTVVEFTGFAKYLSSMDSE